MTPGASAMDSVARELLGEPGPIRGKPGEMRYGTHGSLSVDVRNGRWYDHERGIGGGVLELVMREKGGTQVDAAQWLKERGHLPNEPRQKPHIVASYDYRDEAGTLLYQACRMEPKSFRQRQPDGRGGWVWNVKGVRQVPYRLPEVLSAEAGAGVCIVEGEKDADRLAGIGVVATTNAGGAGKWRAEFAEHLAGKRVCILPDNDSAGRDHARKVLASLRTRGIEAKIVDLPGLPEKGDVSDWLDNGGTVETLGKLYNEAQDAVDDGVSAIEHASPAASRKAPAPNVDNVARIVETDPVWQGVVAYDEFADEMMMLRPVPGTTVPKTTFRARQWRDSDDVSALRWFNRHGFPRMAKSTVADALVDVAQRSLISPVRHYLEDLTWDGEPRLDRWLIDHCGADVVDDEGEDLGGKAQFVAEVGRRWMISAVARALEPGCKADACLVLEGKQGIGKSTLLRILADGGGQPKGRRSWFSDSLQQFVGKDSQSALRGCWIVELPELAAMRRAEVEHVKSYLSRQEDRYRPAYGRHEVEMPRRCVFAGTTNRADYLKGHLDF